MARITINVVSTSNRKFVAKIAKVKDDYVIREDRFPKSCARVLDLRPTNEKGVYTACHIEEDLSAGTYFVSLTTANGVHVSELKKRRGTICKKLTIKDNKALLVLEAHSDVTLDYKAYAEKYTYDERMHNHSKNYDEKFDFFKVVYSMPAADAAAGKRFVCDMVDDYARSVGLSFNEFANYALARSLSKDTRRKFVSEKQPVKK